MGRDVKGNLWEYGPSVDIGSGFSVVPLAGAGGAPARAFLGFWLVSGKSGAESLLALITRRVSSAKSNQCALAATAPTIAPMANHFMARPSRWRREPPRASFSAASRSLPRAWGFVFSSVRSAVAVARRVRQVLQSTAKS